MTPADAPAPAPALAEALRILRKHLSAKVDWRGLPRVVGIPNAAEELAPLLADHAAQAEEIAALKAERDEARDAVAFCNNSFGSYSYHLNPHPAEQIEKVKEHARLEWRRAETAEARAATAEARCERLLIAFHDAIRRPLGVTPDSGLEFFSYRMSDEAEERRPRHGSEAEIVERPETRLRAALAAETEARRVAEAQAAERADAALRKAIRSWSHALHQPVTRMMSRLLREHFSAELARTALSDKGGASA